MENQYEKRDISWLAFNHRVLQEAKDKTVPLYERIKFLAIYSSNLDEFFRVRVASLRSFKELKKKTRKALEIKPKKELKQIRKIVDLQQAEFGKIFQEQIIPQLEEEGIFLIQEAQYTKEQKSFARKYFFEKLYPNFSPIILKEGAAMPFLKNKGLYFVVTLDDCSDLALVEISTEHASRFILLPSAEDKHYITFLDDIIRFNLPEALNQNICKVFAIKLSRDAEMYIDDEYSGDLLEKIKRGLADRNIGLPTRFLYDSDMSESLLNRLKSLFKLSKNDLIPGARYHNFNDFFGFPDPTNNSTLHDPDLAPLPHPDFENVASIMQVLQEKDVMLHFPYQQYDYVPKLILEAADDTSVESIHITLYRVASKSAVVQALLYALGKGKAVTTFIEAKARFDEESNLYWGEQLEKAKANVFYSYPGIKVHTKLLQIARNNDGEVQHLTYLGTGNFNEKTARLYCDHALFTTDHRLGVEVKQVFDLLERKIIIPKCKQLLVSPFTLRDRFSEHIQKEIQNKKAGKEAYMILKMNSLEDSKMIDLLYEASRAGVKIQLIIRGICCLIPGIEGMSKNIEITSIVDRYLEHARVYIFCNDGKEIMYTASADWMTRNLDHRVEVAMPIKDETVFQEIRSIINLQLADNIKARWIDATQSNPYKGSKKQDRMIRAQVDTYGLLEKKMIHSESANS